MDWLNRHLHFGSLNTGTGIGTGTGQRQIPTKALFSYVVDYLIIIILAIIYAALDKLVTPFSQHFSLNNISIQYPYAVHERIPIHIALVLSGAFPAAVILVYTLFIDGLFSHHHQRARSRFNRYTFADRLWELNCGWLGLLLAQGAAFVITGTLKNLCGKPRPDLIDRCQPQTGAADGVPYGLVTKAICTQQDEAIMQDGFRSFPSGHSSSSFAGLFFLSLYLAAKLHVLDHRGEVWRTVIVLIPTLAASCIAMSRIMDARHHPFDVLFGSALGILCAWGAYRQYFPPVSHVWEKGRAYPIRSWGMPVRRPVPGRVLVDTRTLEVLDDRVPEDEDGYDTHADTNAGQTGFTASGYGLGLESTDTAMANQRLRSSRHRDGPLEVCDMDNLDMNMDLEMGYLGGGGHGGSSYQQQLSQQQQQRREQYRPNYPRVRPRARVPVPVPGPAPGPDPTITDIADTTNNTTTTNTNAFREQLEQNRRTRGAPATATSSSTTRTTTDIDSRAYGHGSEQQALDGGNHTGSHSHQPREHGAHVQREIDDDEEDADADMDDDDTRPLHSASARARLEV
ncbi:putative diacylglycerol pyrophosphate phosphatase 1 [Exophiala dermatitidis]